MENYKTALHIYCCFRLAQSVKIIIPCGILLTYALQFYIAVDIIWPNILALLGPNVKYPIFAELSFRSFLVLVTCKCKASILITYSVWHAQLYKIEKRLLIDHCALRNFFTFGLEQVAT